MPFENWEIEYLEKNSDRLIAGIDEAGRGPLAGPVSVGIAVFSKSIVEKIPEELIDLNDSKLLKAEVRERLAAAVREYSVFSAVTHVSSKRIDEAGINAAIETAIIRSVDKLLLFCRKSGFTLGKVLVDGNYKLNKVKKNFPLTEFQSVVKGDSRVFSIAAASVLAKVSRDRRMLKYHKYFPEYGFDKHAGYGTAFHRKMIREKGLCPIHRKSYRIKNSL